MNKQELVALLNEKLNGKKYNSGWIEVDVMKVLNGALGLTPENGVYPNTLDKVLVGVKDQYLHNDIIVLFQNQEVAKIKTHKKKGKGHCSGYVETYYDWSFTEFKEEDIEILNGNTLEEAQSFAAKKALESEQHKRNSLQLARAAMDVLIKELGLKDDRAVADLCKFIWMHSFELRKAEV